MKRAVFSLTVNRRIITAVFAAFIAALAACLLVLSDPGEVGAQEQQEVKQLSVQPIVVDNDTAGDERDPHVSDGLISYTHVSTASEIRLYDLATGTDSTIPHDVGDNDVLSDVSGTKVVFTRQTSQGSFIYLFDTAGTDPPRELAPTPDRDFRTAAAIGANTVAWVDYSVRPSGEIEVHDLASGDTTPLIPEDELLDQDVAVSPSGNLVVFFKCDTTGRNCDIYKSERTTNGTFGSPVAITGADKEDEAPDTDGSLIAYSSLSAGGEQDIFYQPVSGGTEKQISLPGEQYYPSVSGGLIIFYSQSQPGGNGDLFVYDTKTGTLYQLTNTPEHEDLPDIWVGPDGDVQATWQKLEDDLNVYAASFRLPAQQTYNFSGFLRPVNNLPTLNTAKAGSVIPVNFSLSGDQGLNIFEDGYPKSEKVACDSDAQLDGIEETVSPGASTLSYDATTDQYTYVWKTDRAWSDTTTGPCRQLVLKLKDGSTHRANFKFSGK